MKRRMDKENVTYILYGTSFRLYKQLAPLSPTCIDLENIILSKAKHGRQMLHDLIYMWNIIKYTKAESRMWLSGAGGKGNRNI